MLRGRFECVLLLSTGDVEDTREAFIILNPFNLVLKCNWLNIRLTSFKMQLDILLLIIGKETQWLTLH